MAAARATSDLSLWRRLLRELRGERRLAVLVLLIYPVDAVAVVLPPYLVQRVIDVVVPSGDLGELAVFAGAYLGALLLEYCTGVGALLSMGLLGQRVVRGLRNRVFAHAQALPASYYDKHPTGRVLTRVTSDVEALADLFATGAITAITDVFSIVAVLSAMLWLDARLTLYSFLAVPPLVVIAVLFQRMARRAFRAIRRALARINTYLVEHIVGMSVVQVFRQEVRTQREFDALGIEFRDANRRAVLADAALYSIVEAIGTAAVAAILWFGAGDLASQAVGAGTLVAFMQYIRRLFVPIRDLSTKYTVVQSAMAGGERIFELLDEPITIRSPEKAVAPRGLSRELAFDQVWFRYRDEQPWVLRGLELRIAKGERVALVGATGSGKTSVLKLLTRNYDVQEGHVRLDGVDVRELELQALRRQFAVVLQDVYLFSGTVLDNLTLGGRVSAEVARRAARAVHAEVVIDRLPAGYDSLVSEGGQNLSSGERQLLALARAMAIEPEVVLLDEATSNIDSETEAHLEAGLDASIAGRTAIIVAHRLSTIQKVDRIVVLRQGVVAEEGTHGELLRRGGIYRGLVEAQTRRKAV